MKMKRLTAVLLAALLVASAAVGCSKNGSSSESSQSEGSKTEESSSTAEEKKPEGPPTFPLTTEDVTLKIATPDNYYVPKSYNTNLPIYQEFEKLTGVKIAWEAIANDYWTVMNTRLAAASDIPDIMSTAGNVTQLGEDGVILDMKDLIPENAYYLNSLFGMNDMVRKAVTSLDGGIYAYPGFGEGIITNENDMKNGSIVDPGANINLNVPSIRKDWLDKLGLQAPTTLDEWYTVLKAFKTGDPNGNGKNDEIPLAPTWDWRGLLRFSDAFGVYMAGNAGDSPFDVDDSGKLFYKFTQPALKDTLVFLNKLYSEGLIDPEYAVTTYEETGKKINRDLVGSVPSEWMSNSPTWENNLRAGGVKDAQWTPIKSVKNPDGKQITHNRWSIWGNTMISADTKYPELAVQWIDAHCLSPEGIMLQMYGVEGQSYTIEDNKPKYTEFVLKNPDGIGPFEAIRSIGGWCTGLAYIQTKSAYEGLYADLPQMMELGASYKPDEIFQAFPSYSYAKDESEKKAELTTNIETYRNETILKMIEGKFPIEKFDEYVAKIDSLGLPELLEINQTAYDRMMNS